MADSKVPDSTAPVLERICLALEALARQSEAQKKKATKGKEDTKKITGVNREAAEQMRNYLKGKKTMSRYIRELREVHNRYAPADLAEVTRALVATLCASPDVLLRCLPALQKAIDKYFSTPYPDECLPRLDLLYMLGRKILRNEPDDNKGADSLGGLMRCILHGTDERCCWCADDSDEESNTRSEEPTAAQIPVPSLDAYIEECLRLASAKGLDSGSRQKTPAQAPRKK